MGRCDSGFKPIPASIHLCFGALGERSMVGPPFGPSNTFLQKDPELSPLRFPRMYVIGALLITLRQWGNSGSEWLVASLERAFAHLLGLLGSLCSWNPLSLQVSPRVCRPPVFSSFTEYH